jgi:hypothetical protein
MVSSGMSGTREAEKTTIQHSSSSALFLQLGGLPESWDGFFRLNYHEAEAERVVDADTRLLEAVLVPPPYCFRSIVGLWVVEGWANKSMDSLTISRYFKMLVIIS